MGTFITVMVCLPKLRGSVWQVMAICRGVVGEKELEFRQPGMNLQTISQSKPNGGDFFTIL